MNIVMLQHTFNPTTIGWVRGLEARGHRVLTIVTDTSEPYGGWPSDLEVAVIPDSVRWVERIGARLLPGRKRTVFGLPRPRDLRDAMADFGADAVIVKVYSLRNVLALLVALTLRVRRVAWIEQVAPPNLEWRVLRAIGVLPRRVFSALDARPGGIADPLDPPSGGYPVITYAPVIPESIDREPLQGRPVRILTVAAFWEPDNKRPFWTLESARDAELLDGRCMFTFTGLGKEPTEAGTGRKFVSLRILNGLIESLDVPHLVSVRLNVPYTSMTEVFATHDLLVLPSAREQFGMVVPEAMAHGLAVIASDGVGSKGCIVPGVTGELFAGDDRNDLVRVLRALVDEPERIAGMGAAGREFIIRHASPSVTARHIEGLLD